LVFAVGLDTVEELHRHPSNVVDDFARANLDVARHQHIANRLGMLTHFTGPFVGRSLFEELQRFGRKANEMGVGHTGGPQGLQFGNFLLEALQPRARWLRFKLLKAGDRFVWGHN
jgi:hypothetical protein